MQEIICEVDWDAIRVSPFQPRRHFSEEELEELAASIQTVGLIHPPVVRKIESGGKLHYYELIAGERRWRAAKKANLHKIPVIIRETTDEQAAKATLIENIQRVDLDPIELALAFKKLIEVFRMTQEQVAEKVGKKRSTVANYLRLLSLPAPIRASLAKGEVSMGHAKAVLSLETQELQEKLSSEIVRRKLTVREAEKESRALSKCTKKSSNVHVTEIEEKLQQILGTKVRLETQERGGKLVLYYYSLDDLERLLQNFKSYH